MPITIRAAMPQDAQAISQIIDLAFHEQANSEQIQKLIANNKHHTLVVVSDKVLGFIDGFMTIAQDATKRLELDLLAVHPDFTGQGIGKQLISTFTENTQDIDTTRVLVATNNTLMRHAMKATGYQLDPQAQALYISSDSAEKTEISAEAHLISVETFTYSGIWLEGEITLEAIKSAQYQRQKQASDVVGAVISPENKDAIETVKSAGFEHVKYFQWWTKAP